MDIGMAMLLFGGCVGAAAIAAHWFGERVGR